LQRESITKPIRLVDRLKEVFYTQSESIGYLMKTLKRRIYAMVYILAYLLFRHTHKTGKFSVSYVFFINTSYSRNCDSYFCFFIVALFLLLKKAPLPFNKSSEAKI